MILIDLSQIMVASTMMSMGKDQSQVDISMVRHMVLNSLRMYRSKYHEEYGELVFVVTIGTIGAVIIFLTIRQTVKEIGQLLV